jgi:hypothetical protein
MIKLNYENEKILKDKIRESIYFDNDKASIICYNIKFEIKLELYESKDDAIERLCNIILNEFIKNNINWFIILIEKQYLDVNSNYIEISNSLYGKYGGRLENA